jgi:hypothetical protein
MAVKVEMRNNTGDSHVKADVVASIEHALADRPGDWRVLIVGSQTNDWWEMKVAGPNGFERSYALEGSQGKHRPETIRTSETSPEPERCRMHLNALAGRGQHCRNASSRLHGVNCPTA